LTIDFVFTEIFSRIYCRSLFFVSLSGFLIKGYSMRKSFWLWAFIVLTVACIGGTAYLWSKEGRTDWSAYALTLATIMSGAVVAILQSRTKEPKTNEPIPPPTSTTDKSINIPGNQGNVDLTKSIIITGDNNNITTTPTQSPTPEKKKLIRLIQRNPLFTGRKELLDKIRLTFEENKEPIALTQAIAGMGGIGKTQTALEFAYRNVDHYQCIFWVNAETPNNILSSFQEFAEKNEDLKVEMKEAEAIVKEALNWMEKNDNWLMIYDNVENEKSLEPYLPVRTGARQHILITSRNKMLKKYFRVDINVFTEQEACDFIYRYTEKTADKHFKELAKMMGYLPLALDQAGAYLFETKKSYTDYLNRYKEKNLSLLQKYIDDPQKQTVAATWEISLEKIKNNKAAKQLLHLCAFLDPENIYPQFFIDAKDILPDELKKAINDDEEFHLAIAKLVKYSLVSQNKEGILSLHRLVQEVIRESIKNEQPAWRRRCILILNELRFFDFSTRALRDRFLILAAHITAVTYKNIIEETEELANLYYFLGYGYNDLAEYKPALEYYKKALSIRENVLGKDHPDTAATYNNMAAVYHAQGVYERALEYYGKALAIDEKVSGLEHPSTATTYNNMAAVYDAQGDYELALEYHEKAKTVREKVLGEEHPSTADTYNNMAVVYYNMGDYERALEYYGKASAICEKVLGEEHPSTAATYNNMALIYYAQDDYDRALEYCGKALAIYEKVFGAEHPSYKNTKRGIDLISLIFNSN